MTPVALMTGTSDGRIAAREPRFGAGFDRRDRPRSTVTAAPAPDASRSRSVAVAARSASMSADRAEARFERAHRRPLTQLLDRRNDAKVGHARTDRGFETFILMASNADHSRAGPPDYRPLERFWPYADLPEQPTAEELAALDPELNEALFGAQPRPFSITLDFPAFDGPDFRACARDGARVGGVPRDSAPATARRHRARFCPRDARQLRDRSSSSSGASTRPRC